MHAVTSFVAPRCCGEPSPATLPVVDASGKRVRVADRWRRRVVAARTAGEIRAE